MLKCLVFLRQVGVQLSILQCSRQMNMLVRVMYQSSLLCSMQVMKIFLVDSLCLWCLLQFLGQLFLCFLIGGRLQDCGVLCMVKQVNMVMFMVMMVGMQKVECQLLNSVRLSRNSGLIRLLLMLWVMFYIEIMLLCFFCDYQWIMVCLFGGQFMFWVQLLMKSRMNMMVMLEVVQCVNLKMNIIVVDINRLNGRKICGLE